MHEPEHNAIRPGEIALIVVVVGALLAAFVPGVIPSRKLTADQKSVTAALRRIEKAKQQFVLDRKKQPGEPVSLQDLVRGGYLEAEPEVNGGGAFVVGAVGIPVEYDADATQQNGSRD